MKKSIKVLLCTLVVGAVAVFGAGCSLKETLKQLTCKHDFGATATEVTQEATCTDEGTELWTCTLCGKEKTETIAKLDHVFDEGVIKKEATCTETGEILYTCTTCEKQKTEIIKKNEHARVNVEAKAPTCTEDGYTDYSYCADCNTFLSPKTLLKAMGHSSAVVKGYAATCTETGLRNGEYCVRCDTVLTEQTEIAAKGHNVVTVKGYAATCTEAGLTDGQACKDCGTIYVEQVVIPAGHTVVVDEAVAATCTESGLTEGSHCSVCDTVILEQTEIPALEHNPVSFGGKPATCTENGAANGVMCSRCEEVLFYPEVTPATGHSFEDGVCTSCGLSRDESLYDFVESGNYTLAEVEVGETVVGNWYRIYDTRTYDEDRILEAVGCLELGNLHIRGARSINDVPFTHIGCDSHGGYYTTKEETALFVGTWLLTKRGNDENGYYTDVYIDSATITSLTSAGLPCSHTIDSTTTVSAVYTYSNGGDDAPIMVYRLAPISTANE